MMVVGDGHLHSKSGSQTGVDHGFLHSCDIGEDMGHLVGDVAVGSLLVDVGGFVIGGSLVGDVVDNLVGVIVGNYMVGVVESKKKADTED